MYAPEVTYVLQKGRGKKRRKKKYTLYLKPVSVVSSHTYLYQNADHQIQIYEQILKLLDMDCDT